MKKNSYTLLWVLLCFILLWSAVSFFNSPNNSKKMPYSEVVSYFKNEQVKNFTIKDNKLTFELKTGETHKISLYSPSLFIDDVEESLKKVGEENALEYYHLDPPMVLPWWATFVIYGGIFLVVILLWFFMMNQMGGGGKAMNFGKMRPRFQQESQKKVTFEDVAGADEEKEELEEIVEFLKNPRKFTDLGARIPKGVLLLGPPGTGKTLLAKSVAGEAEVPFFSLSGSDFVELYVGVGASRVRDLFDQAKKSSPSIVFIDEIDAVGRQRGAGLGGGHDEREQTLNQLLVEMDGFADNQGVIVIAATNRPDILDHALLRPGRFDRQVVISHPDVKGREAILKVHSKGKKISGDIDMNRIAKGTPGFTGADLANILNEAALMAARRKKTAIDINDIEDAKMKVIIGVEKKTRVVTEKDRKMTAYHEAGHAIVTKFLETQDPVHEISIIPRGRAGGYTLSLPGDDKSYMSKNEMIEDVIVLLGGRVAEKLIFDDVTTGASNDIERASAISRNMVTKYGMSDKIGPIVFGSSHDEVFLGRDFTTQRNFSENIASLIDEEITSIIDNAYKKASDILTAQMGKMHELANLLLVKEKISGEEFNKLFDGLKEEEVKDVSDNNGEQ